MKVFLNYPSQCAGGDYSFEEYTVRTERRDDAPYWNAGESPRVMITLSDFGGISGPHGQGYRVAHEQATLLLPLPAATQLALNILAVAGDLTRDQASLSFAYKEQN